MSGIYEEVEIEDMKFLPESGGIFTFPCPCGDKFSITLDELLDGDDIASCPSCTLKIKVIYDDEVLGGYETLVQEHAELEKSEKDVVKDDGIVA